MSWLEIVLLLGFIVSTICLVLYSYYVFKFRRMAKSEITVKERKEIYKMFKGWLVIFIFFFLVLVVFFCLSMFIVEISK